MSKKLSMMMRVFLLRCFFWSVFIASSLHTWELVVFVVALIRTRHSTLLGSHGNVIFHSIQFVLSLNDFLLFLSRDEKRLLCVQLQKNYLKVN